MLLVIVLCLVRFWINLRKNTRLSSGVTHLTRELTSSWVWILFAKLSKMVDLAFVSFDQGEAALVSVCV